VCKVRISAICTIVPKRQALTLRLELLGHYSLGDLGEQVLLVGLQVSLELLVPLDNPLDGDLVQETLDTGHDKRNLDLGGDGRVLTLLQELGKTLSSGQQVPGGLVQVGTERSESGDFSVLGQVQLQGTGDGLHDLGLGGGTDSGDGKTDVDSGSNTLCKIEKKKNIRHTRQQSLQTRLDLDDVLTH
jgi:hypothetical protein